MQKIIILGGGGHSKVLIDLVRIIGKYEITGILDLHLRKGATVSDIPVLGGDDLLEVVFNNGTRTACIAVGSVRDNDKRCSLFVKAKQIGFTISTLIHPNAFVSRESKITEGVQVMAGAIIQTNSFVAENSIINTGAIIEHDCKIGKHVHICPGAVISGECTIDEGVFVGAGATIIQGVRVGNNCMVAAGAVVINDIPSGTMVMGIPAKRVNQNG
jgi:sugar O-acyltransferase (sialic acid O-acetyltransferase NeuD family)